LLKTQVTLRSEHLNSVYVSFNKSKMLWRLKIIAYFLGKFTGMCHRPYVGTFMTVKEAK